MFDRLQNISFAMQEATAKIYAQNLHVYDVLVMTLVKEFRILKTQHVLFTDANTKQLL